MEILKMSKRSLTVAVLSATSVIGLVAAISAASSSFVGTQPIEVAACPIEGCPPQSEPTINSTPDPFGPLTGKWKADDGGTYYLRRVGNQVWWYGEPSPTNPGWSNVFVGTVQGNQISGSWADVPKGGAQGNGNMQLRIVSSTRLEAISNSGSGFGGKVWTR
jgi:hypothetical protein